MMRFVGKTALITGAAQGSGRMIARTIAREGGNVALVDVNEEKLLALQAELQAAGYGASIHVCDVSLEEDVKRTAAQALDKWGRIDILINNAGIWRCDQGPFIRSERAGWEKKIGVNILGVMQFCREIVPGMVEQGYGRVVNIGSVAGVYGKCNMVDYCMTKGAVSSFSLALAKEVAPYGVTVNTVSPGNINNFEDPNVNYEHLSFLNRSGTTQECANVVCFLASDDASYVCGQNYLVDGCRKSM